MNQPPVNHPPTAQNQDGSVPIPELRDILLPQEVSSYVIAPGWLLVGVLTAIVLSGLLYWGALVWQKNAFKRQALKELKLWYEQQDNEVTQQKLLFLSNLLKRVILVANRPDNLASLHTNNWQKSLDKLAPNCLSKDSIELLAYGQYQPQLNTTLTVERLNNECQKWLKNYRPKTTLSFEETHA